jgi:hypothetical protein
MQESRRRQQKKESKDEEGLAVSKVNNMRSRAARLDHRWGVGGKDAVADKVSTR